MDALLTAFHLVFEPKTVLVMLASSVFGVRPGRFGTLWSAAHTQQSKASQHQPAPPWMRAVLAGPDLRVGPSCRALVPYSSWR